VFAALPHGHLISRTVLRAVCDGRQVEQADGLELVEAWEAYALLQALARAC
jgi:hypothetical protein